MPAVIRVLLRYWIPVIVWMLLIYRASGDLMSSEHTSRFLVPFLQWIAPEISPATLASIQLLIRKTTHLAEYAILTALLWRAFDQGQGRFRRAAVRAFVVASAYAALDEFHQSFIPSRTGAPQDVAIDCVGALLGLMLCLLATRLALRRKSKG